MLHLFRKKQFKKDLKKLIRNPEFDPSAFEYVLSRLMHQEKLEKKYFNHSLTGEFRGCSECHVQPDILLIYTIDTKEKLISLVRIGSHAELFI